MRIGIRREDKNEYEARVPLIPDHIRQLTQELPVTFIIQPSRIRAFKDDEYRQAGAIVREDLSDCDIILAVKEIPLHFFQHGKQNHAIEIKRKITNYYILQQHF